jgi:futalosine hydrolase
MKLLMVAATHMEIAPAIASLTNSDFMLQGHTTDVLITGVGQVPATWMLTNALHTNTPNLVIQAGIAGTFSPRLAPGTVVCVQKDCFGDLGMEANGQFTTIFDNGLAQPNDLPFINGWLVNNSPVLTHLPWEVVSAVTVNKVTDSMIQRQQLIDTFNPGIETMEGAACHYVCISAGVPFVQLRAISNEVGERDKSKWLIQEAISNLNNELLQLIATTGKYIWTK